jgi:DNA-binding CsgD family transcriptional regulator
MTQIQNDNRPEIDLPPGNPRNPANLTDREFEVMSHVGRGESNADIARALYLSVNTVKTHLRHAYRRIGVSRRVDAVLWASRHAPHQATSDSA